MNTAAYFIVTMIFATALYFGIRWLVRVYSKYRGIKIVACPETGSCAVVEVDTLHASLTSIMGHPDIRLETCSRWPMKSQCGQEGLAHLDVAPGECLVSGLLMRWYRGRNCVYCGKPAEELQWMDHQPALGTEEGELVGRPGVPVENSSMVVKTHLPVCWNCYLAQSFRGGHRDEVFDGPRRHGIPGDADGSSASRRI
ncbi:MAG TPA: hypothetical protein VEW46_18205 [Pyrinomonadaceae bacterium]|nr:hypothetical protein [Pyrinomonadaceae bacterium]